MVHSLLKYVKLYVQFVSLLTDLKEIMHIIMLLAEMAAAAPPQKLIYRDVNT